jgi:membrane protein YdbS with pleckstrin-like domain
MKPNSDQMSVFDHILDPDERIVWIQKPRFKPYLAGGLEIFILLFLCGAFILYFAATQKDATQGLYWISAAIMVLSTFKLVWRLLRFKHVSYAYTNKRILIQRGLRGKRIKVIEFDQVVEITVDITSIDRYYGVGSIKFFTGETTPSDDGRIEKLYVDMDAIDDPFVVFANLKDVMSDYKTLSYGA